LFAIAVRLLRKRACIQRMRGILGVIAMFSAILSLLILPYVDFSNLRGIQDN
jgi:quinol-cytochrome oxidoreductase complex cytochrome b subunit